MIHERGTAQSATVDAAPRQFERAPLQIKICGLRTAEHALVAANAGATMLGFVFAPSKRQITLGEAAEIIAAVQAQAQQAPKIVGLFVNAPGSEIARIVERCKLDWLQLCGNEPVELRDDLPTIPLLRAIRLDGSASEAAWLALPPEQVTPLIDAHVKGSYGGSGALADWPGAAHLAQQRNVMLAGGLTPENVGAALTQVQPWGLDVSSGVEREGRKDSQRIRQFIAHAYTAYNKVGQR